MATYFRSNPYPIVETSIHGGKRGCKHVMQKRRQNANWLVKRCTLCGYTITTTKRFR